jgi:hypothetical protein
MSQLIISVDPTELATILAALRYYQQEGQISLDAAGIDTLCERINQDTPVRCVIGLEGGLVTGVTANVSLEFTVLDYDVEGCDDDEVMTVPSLGEEGKVVDVFKRGFWNADVSPGIVDRLHAAIELILDEEE